MGSSRFFFGLLMVIVLSTAVIFVKNSALGPRFRISNDSVQNVVVTTKWRDQTRDLGTIEPGATISLIVKDEAAMVFIVRYADGSELSSEPVYFTFGITTNISILEESIDVKQDVDT